MKASARRRQTRTSVWGSLTSLAIPHGAPPGAPSGVGSRRAGRPRGRSVPDGGSPIVTPPGVLISMESLILAQDERWRRASYMQVEREARSLLRVESGERVRNT